MFYARKKYLFNTMAWCCFMGVFTWWVPDLVLGVAMFFRFSRQIRLKGGKGTSFF
jgi:hypothetical protein